MIHGALAAAVTPLRDGGARLDEDAFGPIADFLAGGGLDGILALGTTGEGILLRATSAAGLPSCTWRPAAAGSRSPCTAAPRRPPRRWRSRRTRPRPAPLRSPSSRRRTSRYPTSRSSQHFAAQPQSLRARCLLPLRVRGAERIRDPARYRAPSRGRSESCRPEGLRHAVRSVEPYLIEGLDIFIGSEPLLPRGLAQGAAGTVSGLAAAFPSTSPASIASPKRTAPSRS